MGNMMCDGDCAMREAEGSEVRLRGLDVLRSAGRSSWPTPLVCGMSSFDLYRSSGGPVRFAGSDYFLEPLLVVRSHADELHAEFLLLRPANDGHIHVEGVVVTRHIDQQADGHACRDADWTAGSASSDGQVSRNTLPLTPFAQQ